MAKRFRGEGLHKVDAKGRVSIPAAYRRVLAENDPDWAEGLNPNLVIVYGDEDQDFLEGYSVAAMHDLEDRIEAMPIGSEERDYVEMVYLGFSQDTSVDDTGRLVLSAKLREKAGIDKEAYFVSKGTTFEIWNPERFEERRAARLKEFREKRPAGFNAKSLLQQKADSE